MNTFAQTADSNYNLDTFLLVLATTLAIFQVLAYIPIIDIMWRSNRQMKS